MEHPLQSEIILMPDESGITEKEIPANNPFSKLLSPGQVFKNYTVFCQHLGIEVKNGRNTKKHQLSDLRCYFDFHKVDGKQQLIIDKVYDEPIKKPMRASNSPLKDMDKLICHNLYSGQLKDYVTYSNLSVSLGLVNDAFSRIRSGYSVFDNSIPFDPSAGVNPGCSSVFRIPAGQDKQCWKVLIRALANEVYKSYRSSIESTLQRMESNGYIKIEHHALVKLRNGGIRIADEDDCISDVYRQLDTLDALGCPNMKAVHKKNLFDKYCKEKQTRLSKYADYDYIFSAKRLIPVKKMDLSNFDAQSTRKALPSIFFRQASKWKSVSGSKLSLFLLNRMILPNPIWDYEMFESLWQENMPCGITVAEWPQHFDWLFDRGTCKLPNSASSRTTPLT